MNSLILTLALAVPAAPPAPVAAETTPATTSVATEVAPAAVATDAAPAPVATAAPVAAAPGAFAQHFAVPACPVNAAGRSFPLVPNTLLELETVEELSSKTSHLGMPFTMRVREPLKYGAVELIPAGTLVHGEVTHVMRKGAGGRPGELILSARYTQLPEGRLKLKANLGNGGGAGKNNAAGAAVMYAAVGLVGLLVQGKDLVMPAGTPLSARLAENVSFDCAGAAAPVVPAPITP